MVTPESRKARRWPHISLVITSERVIIIGMKQTFTADYNAGYWYVKRLFIRRYGITSEGSNLLSSFAMKKLKLSVYTGGPFLKITATTYKPHRYSIKMVLDRPACDTTFARYKVKGYAPLVNLCHSGLILALEVNTAPEVIYLKIEKA